MGWTVPNVQATTVYDDLLKLPKRAKKGCLFRLTQNSNYSKPGNNCYFTLMLAKHNTTFYDDLLRLPKRAKKGCLFRLTQNGNYSKPRNNCRFTLMLASNPPFFALLIRCHAPPPVALRIIQVLIDPVVKILRGRIRVA